MHHLDGDARVAHDGLDEVRPLQCERLCLLDGDGAGRTWLPVQQGQLAKVVAWSEDGQRDLLSVGAGEVDLDLAALDDIEHLSGVVAVKDDLPGPERAAADDGSQVLQCLGIKPGEKRYSLQCGEIVAWVTRQAR